MNNPTREQVIRMLMSDEVYQALNLDPYFNKEEGRYPSIYEVLSAAGIEAVLDKALLKGGKK